MNKDQFISLIKNPVAMNLDSVALLSGVVREFPYFQTAQLLYTKNLYEQNSMHYSGQLKIAAAYVSDRKVLYHLINTKQAFVSSHKPEEAEDSTLNNIIEEKSIQEDAKKNEVTAELKRINSRSVSQPQVEKKDIEIVKIVLEEPRNNQVPDVEVDVKNMSLLDQEIISKAIDASIKQEVDEPLLEDKREIAVDSPIEDVSITPDSKFTFSDWLKLADPNTPKEQKKKLNYSEMIDKFIVQEPKMTRPAASFYSPVDKARKSVVDNYEVVTETLAKIYVKQGNFPKAIKVYESLRLKYPGKSSYFVARIQEIEKLVNH